MCWLFEWKDDNSNGQVHKTHFEVKKKSQDIPEAQGWLDEACTVGILDFQLV